MKKLYNPLPTGGAPVFTETLNTTELEIWAAVEGVLSRLDPTRFYPTEYQAAPSTNYVSTGIIVSGGEVTDNTTDWDLAAGIAYFPVAGRFARFAAEATIANADYAMITLDSPVTTQKAFFDASNKNYYVEYSASVATLTPPAAEPGSEYVCVRKVETLEIHCYMGHPSLSGIFHQLAHLTTVGEKYTLTGLNSWTLPSFLTTVRNFGRLTKLEIFAQSAASATNDICAQISSPNRPNLDVIGHVQGSTSGTIYPVLIDAGNGNVSIIGGSGQTETNMEGVITYFRSY